MPSTNTLFSKIDFAYIFLFLTFCFYSYFRQWICIVGRAVYLAGGMNIVIKGVKASCREAPLLVIAPHSTFLDSCISYVTGFPSIIARIEDGLNPWVGSTCQRNKYLYFYIYIFMSYSQKKKKTAVDNKKTLLNGVIIQTMS